MFSKILSIAPIDTGIASFIMLYLSGTTSYRTLKIFHLSLNSKSILYPSFVQNLKMFSMSFDQGFLRYLFQLRVGLSRLRHHKKSHNFIDTPSNLCLCKTGIEDTRHYLLACPFYATHRNVLFSTVENIIREKELNKLINSYLPYNPISLHC